MRPSDPDNPDRRAPARQGLARLLLLRACIAALGAAALPLLRLFPPVGVSPAFAAALAACALASALLGYWRLRTAPVITHRELFCHLLADVVLLVVLLANTGGIGNPLISYLLVLLAVAATLLPKPLVYAFAAGCILIYTSFLALDIRTGHALDAAAADQDAAFRLHLVGMWVIFLVSAALISVFLTRMASAIRERELNLAKARENEMRSEQLVAIGTLAAGTAHALGTPLSTMAVLLGELDRMDERELKSGEVKRDISVLKEQVARCRDSLGQLIRYYHRDGPGRADTVRLSAFAAEIRDYVANIHPAARVRFVAESPDDAAVASEPSARHAVINLLENGIKAAGREVTVTFRVVDAAPARFEIAIQDDGPGIPAAVMENMGEPFISTRKDSMGLGIFLANAAVRRLGGTVEMFNLKLGGALTLIRLPLRPAARG